MRYWYVLLILLLFIGTGRMEKAPKKAGLRKVVAEEKKITKIINGQNEGTFAGVAQNAGGKLSVLKAPLPVDSRSKNVRKNGKGVPWGASSK